MGGVISLYKPATTLQPKVLGFVQGQVQEFKGGGGFNGIFFTKGGPTTFCGNLY